MAKILSKEQKPLINKEREVGIVIDCEEITIAVFPPPREHGKPHCHVVAKRSCKVRGKKMEVFPALKIFLDGTEVIVTTEGFSVRDIEIIADIIFNDPPNGEIANDEYLLKLWENLHGKSKTN